MKRSGPVEIKEMNGAYDRVIDVGPIANLSWKKGSESALKARRGSA